MGFKDLFSKKKETDKEKTKEKSKEKSKEKTAVDDAPETAQDAEVTGPTNDTTDTVITPEQRAKWSKTLLPTGAVGMFPLKEPFDLEFAAKGDSKLQHYLALTTVYLGHDLPLNAVTFDRREDNSVVLHATPKIQGAPIGFAGQERAFRSNALIVLPRSDEANGEFNHIERQTLEVGRSRETYRFSFPIPDVAARLYRVEKFEWRRKPGENEDKKIDRRLVRMRTSTEEQEDVVCRWIGTPWWRKRESNVIGTMCFEGTGSTGQLGPKWALMVVMSNLRIVNEDMHWNEMGAVLKSGGTVAFRAASLAAKIGVEIATNV